ncbi:MAG: macro domain-containing protein [Chloroflexota bacterium]
MITYVHGDLFYSPARVLVNPVNTVGAMGSGTAYDFKRFFPDMYEAYRDLCQRDEFATGQLMLYRTPHKWILNFPIKKHFRAQASLDNIEEGLKKFVRVYAEQHLTSVSFPALGTDEDDLEWTEVKPMMESYLDPLPISVYVHIHTDKTSDERRSTRAMKTWLTGRPTTVDFDRFWKELYSIISDGISNKPHIPFKAVATDAKGRQRVSLKLTPRHGETIFLPETQLRDLWQYVTRAGYILPQNLPAGL